MNLKNTHVPVKIYSGILKIPARHPKDAGQGYDL